MTLITGQITEITGFTFSIILKVKYKMQVLRSELPARFDPRKASWTFVPNQAGHFIK